MANIYQFVAFLCEGVFYFLPYLWSYSGEGYIVKV